MLIYLGSRGDQDAPFEYQGFRFPKGVVTPVTDSVFEMFCNFHNFREIKNVGSVIVDWPKEARI